MPSPRCLADLQFPSPRFGASLPQTMRALNQNPYSHRFGPGIDIRSRRSLDGRRGGTLTCSPRRCASSESAFVQVGGRSARLVSTFRIEVDRKQTISRPTSGGTTPFAGQAEPIVGSDHLGPRKPLNCWSLERAGENRENDKIAKGYPFAISMKLEMLGLACQTVAGMPGSLYECLWAL